MKISEIMIFPDTDFNMTSSETISSFLNLIPHATIIEQSGEYILYRYDTYLFLVNNEKILYMSRCISGNNKFLGKFNVQSSVWKDKNENKNFLNGYPSYIFRKYYINPTVVSDIAQTTDAIKFWKREIKNSIKQKMVIGVISYKDSNFIDIYNYDENIEDWYTRFKVWDIMDSNGIRLFITKNKLNHIIKENIDDLENDLKSKYELRSISLFRKKNDLKLNMIAVPKDKLGQGIGTKVMQEICDYADNNNLRLILTTGTKDSNFGTTSTKRLISFYKKFGFVENKGRHKDFSISENMYREPNIS